MSLFCGEKNARIELTTSFTLSNHTPGPSFFALRKRDREDLMFFHRASSDTVFGWCSWLSRQSGGPEFDSLSARISLFLTLLRARTSNFLSVSMVCKETLGWSSGYDVDFRRSRVQSSRTLFLPSRGLEKPVREMPEYRSDCISRVFVSSCIVFSVSFQFYRMRQVPCCKHSPHRGWYQRQRGRVVKASAC